MLSATAVAATKTSGNIMTTRFNPRMNFLQKKTDTKLK